MTKPRSDTKAANYFFLLTKVIQCGPQQIPTSKIKSASDFRVRVVQCQARYFPNERFKVSMKKGSDTATISLRDDPLATDDDFDY